MTVVTTNTEILDQTAQMTNDMRRNAAWIAELGQARRDRWRELHENGVTQMTIAKACDVTSQTVHNEIKRSRAE